MMTEALIFLSQPETMPFSISLVLMALIGAVSLLGLDFEVGVDAPSIDMDIDADAGINGISIIDWVNPGRLPFLAALALFLMHCAALPASSLARRWRPLLQLLPRHC